MIEVDISDKMFSGMSTQDMGEFVKALYDKERSGHLYVISNDAWPEWVKIGMAVDAKDRLKGYQTSSPLRNYKLIHSVYFEDRHKAEQKAHVLAATKTKSPWNKPDNGEWFRLTHEEAIQIVESIND
tara:strand:- start:439 stop:819 length:381 start_codon:yes stop_codon:yes gene_type:complete